MLINIRIFLIMSLILLIKHLWAFRISSTGDDSFSNIDTLAVYNSRQICIRFPAILVVLLLKHCISLIFLSFWKSSLDVIAWLIWLIRDISNFVPRRHLKSQIQTNLHGYFSCFILTTSKALNLTRSFAYMHTFLGVYRFKLFLLNDLPLLLLF